MIDHYFIEFVENYVTIVLPYIDWNSIKNINLDSFLAASCTIFKFYHLLNYS